MSQRTILGGVSLLALALATSTPALAQTQGGADEGQRTIDEIVVTAQKREQSLQDVPIVVTSVNAQ